MSPEMKEIAEKAKKLGSIFRRGLTSKTHLKRDVVVIGSLLIAWGFFSFDIQWSSFRDKLPKWPEWSSEEVSNKIEEVLSEEQVYQEVRAVRETINTDNWRVYQSRWYGIELKYPENWSVPRIEAAPRSVAWEYRYQFRRNKEDENNPYVGFDLVIYNVAKVKELSATAEFPSVKDEALKSEGMCDTIEGHLIETGDYPAEEIYIPPTDDCYNSTLFFSFTKDQYMYNLVPRTKESIETTGDPRVEIVDSFPEFFAAVSTLKITDIVRMKAAPSKPKIAVPKPAAAVKINGAGKMVCAKKNDRPGKSDKNKKKHLDMECCLDPDEYPNPWCDYSAKKYSKYL